ncbi:MAG: peptidylprolyl isomerase [Pirellulales bacterium]
MKRLMKRLLIRATAVITLALMLAGCGKGDPVSPAVTASISAGPDAAESSTQNANGDVTAPPIAVNPQVRISTSLGDFVVRLDDKNAPITVKNFLWCANTGRYDDTIFHQVLEDYVALGGGYTVDLVERPTHFTIRNEAFNRVKNLRGTIAMARQPDVVDSSTCQFFINLADNPQLDHRSEEDAEGYGYCVFGKVVEGWDVVEQIAQVKAADKDGFVSVPVVPVVIHSVSHQ